MEYEIISYNEITRNHTIKDRSGKQYMVDLFVDASFSPNILGDENLTIEEVKEIEQSLVGKSIDIARLEPCVYFGCECKLLS